jgi:hypothetical protein
MVRRNSQARPLLWVLSRNSISRESGGRADWVTANVLGSTLAYAGVRDLIGFGLDTALHQDPRDYRSSESGFWRRTKHAFHATIFTRTDAGGETVATWRFGSAYAATFLSNEWYPDRVNTVKLGLEQGTTQIGFDLLANMGSEFWPDVKKKILRHKR